VNVLDLEKTILPLFFCFTEVEYTVRSPRSRLLIESNAIFLYSYCVPEREKSTEYQGNVTNFEIGKNAMRFTFLHINQGFNVYV
jgi:hypothetical protein